MDDSFERCWRRPIARGVPNTLDGETPDFRATMSLRASLDPHRRQARVLFDPTPFMAATGAPLPPFLGPFRVCSILGEGGGGIVYEVTDTRSGGDQVLALKVTHGDHFSWNEQERFLGEAGRMRRVEH